MSSRVRYQYTEREHTSYCVSTQEIETVQGESTIGGPAQSESKEEDSCGTKRRVLTCITGTSVGSCVGIHHQEMNCCKLYLVPEEVINTWRAEQREQAVDKPVHHLVTQMDDGLNAILNKEDVSDYDKEKLYSQELSKYLEMRGRKRGGLLPPPSHDPGPLLLSSMPKTFRTKAEGLLEFLKGDRDLRWDEEGHVYIKDRMIEDSNITDLIHDAMRHRKRTVPPAGWHEFSAHLRSRNVPKELVGNQNWWQPSTPEEVWSTPQQKVPSKPKERHSEKEVWSTPPQKSRGRHLESTKKKKTKRKITSWESIPTP